MYRHLTIALSWFILVGMNLVLMAIAYPAAVSVPKVVPPAFHYRVQEHVQELPPANTTVFENDTRFSQEQIQAMNELSIRSGINDDRYRWRGQIAFQISNSFSQSDYNIINSALQNLASVLSNCLEVRLWGQNDSPSGDYVYIKNDEPGCWSYVGRQGGRQELNLQTPGCNHQGIVVHEMIHAVGFHHEQVRPDRNNYVRINWDNIRPGTENNFHTHPLFTSTYDVPYDYYSIMHYGERDFSVNGQRTIQAFDSDVIVGSRGVVTANDRRKLRAMYSCSD